MDSPFKSSENYVWMKFERDHVLYAIAMQLEKVYLGVPT